MLFFTSDTQSPNSNQQYPFLQTQHVKNCLLTFCYVCIFITILVALVVIKSHEFDKPKPKFSYSSVLLSWEEAKNLCFSMSILDGEIDIEHPEAFMMSRDYEEDDYSNKTDIMILAYLHGSYLKLPTVSSNNNDNECYYWKYKLCEKANGTNVTLSSTKESINKTIKTKDGEEELTCAFWTPIVIKNCAKSRRNCGDNRIKILSDNLAVHLCRTIRKAAHDQNSKDVDREHARRADTKFISMASVFLRFGTPEFLQTESTVPEQKPSCATWRKDSNNIMPIELTNMDSSSKEREYWERVVRPSKKCKQMTKKKSQKNLSSNNHNASSSSVSQIYKILQQKAICSIQSTKDNQEINCQLTKSSLHGGFEFSHKHKLKYKAKSTTHSQKVIQKRIFSFPNPFVSNQHQNNHIHEGQNI